MTAVKADSEGLRTSLRAFVADLAVNAERALATAVKVAEGAARQTDSWKDGEEYWPDDSPRRRAGVHTRDTIDSHASGLKGWLEGGGASRFLEGGTRPHVINAHVINARRGGFLRFFVNGEGPIYARSVNHPGTKPTFYLRAAATEGGVFLSGRLRGVVREAKRRYGL